MASGYALGGHVAEADKVLAKAQNPAERLALLKQIAGRLKGKGIFLNNDSALFMLAVFNPNYQQELAIELKNAEGEMKADITALVPKATQLHPLLMTPSPLTRPINFRYRLGKEWSIIQEMLLMTGVDLVNKGKLNNQTLLLLTTFLSPISSAEALDLSNKLFVRYRPDLFYKNLAAHNRLLTTDLSIVKQDRKKESNTQAVNQELADDSQSIKWW